MTKPSVCVLGPSGRMGRLVLDLALAGSDFANVFAVDHPDNPLCGQHIGNVSVLSDLSEALRPCDVYVDFTTPTATALAARAATEHRTAAVIGTTGLTADANAAIDALSQVAPVLTAPNFSIGVNVLLAAAETAARALGSSYDLEVVELHHKRKRDAPSGTALALGRALARGQELDFDRAKQLTREGEIGPRTPGEIGIATVRGGDIPGEHTAYLIGERDRLEITHRAASRSIFAEGALRAATWLATKPPGRYVMRDLLGLGDV